jgi:hypothetical protein
MNCYSLRQFVVASSVTTIEQCAFLSCTRLELVIFSETSLLHEVQRNAFMFCKSLTKLPLPDSVTQIGMGAVGGCTSLTTFRIPHPMTAIDMNIFYPQNHLLTIEIPATVCSLTYHCRDIDNPHIGSFQDLRNVAFPPRCQVARNVTCKFISLVTLFSNDEEMTHMLSQRFEGLPIHGMCYHHTYGDVRDLIRKINHNLGGESMTGTRRDCIGMTPLHILACSTSHTMEMYQLLVLKYPENLVTKDGWGDVPLLYAFWSNAPKNIVLFLVESYKQLYPMFVLEWEKMIHTLIVGGAPALSVQNLLDVHKSNFSGHELNLHRVVTHLLVKLAELKEKQNLCSSIVETFRVLLRVVVLDHIDSLGKGKWRCELMIAVNMIRFERTTEIFLLLDLCKSLRESTSILELALWKARILLGECVGDGMIGNRELCRINCGADIIVPNVLTFLWPGVPEIFDDDMDDTS